ncbi:UbiA family prenyltransferase [Parathalassolituus penaei]|uniref:UbiA family prenyltransferase n=1 Tax=Parathalassolituus penaei TaxID=2997323 RepID=A0A9X3EPA3_9GAMM|nr:UbiA family prenyltransferase [Parathalassolituus penaei]MCY0966358.1 UbiA family prenyltransferase [Parathalassolituus penaei]
MITKATEQTHITPPLVVDLDGTLISTDMLVESGLGLLRSDPLAIRHLPGWLAQGKAVLKQRLADYSLFSPAHLPYNPAVLALIDEARLQQRPVILATASHASIAHAIADHLGCFDQVLASDGENNLSAHHKATALQERFGQGGFDYVGNSNDDLPVWQLARHAILVNTPASVQGKAVARGNVLRVIGDSRTPLQAWVKALRPHQWSKNALLLLPLLASHQFGSVAAVLATLAGILLFSSCASSAYLLNDLLDLPDDRKHPSKCRRPLAAGKIPPLQAALLSPLLALGPLLLAVTFLPGGFSLALLCYFVLTLTYSFWLKRKMAIDVITLAMLYTLRIIAGALVIQVPLTFWILTFSLFIFLSLALMKRFTELKQAREKGQTAKAGGRGYYPDDLEMVASMGVSSGFLSVLILALYIQDPTTAVHYSHPQLLWLACPIMLWWITRVWFLTHRGEMQDDPVLFAIRDRTSLITVGLLAFCFGVAL